MKNAQRKAAEGLAADMEHDGPTEQNSPAGWAPKAETYPVEYAGQATRVTVPPDADPAELLDAALQENMTPDAIAVIASRLGKVRTMDPDVTRQVEWFRRRLEIMLGGPDAVDQMCQALGL